MVMVQKVLLLLLFVLIKQTNIEHQRMCLINRQLNATTHFVSICFPMDTPQIVSGKGWKRICFTRYFYLFSAAAEQWGNNWTKIWVSTSWWATWSRWWRVSSKEIIHQWPEWNIFRKSDSNMLTHTHKNTRLFAMFFITLFLSFFQPVHPEVEWFHFLSDKLGPGDTIE